MSQELNDTDAYTGTVTLDDVLGVFDAVPGPVITSGDVAETVECSRETVRQKLHSLEDRGNVASRKTADRVVWSLVDDHDPQVVLSSFLLV
jgi:response regulator of citrate/malate metabolism